ncbi:hypothetical protein B4143_2758 [Bacillus subtilis]|uniref:hypothetical protein n=1 Tax=Bacillus subtilis TaxID=1423 RepID=UPI0005B6ED84|nr:hypothetical protein [Bacillus subtilis]KIO60029.1 hypothetical protein B4143_2758 [Bacillus subtilis]
MELNLSYMSISELLEKAAENNEIIYTRSNQRLLGKTTALIQFARENNSPILMHDSRVAKDYQELHPDLTFISYENEIAIDGLTNVVCDEGVPLCVVERLHGLGQLLTGFARKPFSEEKSFCPFVVATDAISYVSSKYGVDVAIPEKDFSSLTVEQIKEPPLLQIELDNLGSVPRVFYKGEEIKNKVRVDFSYLTGDEYGSKPIYIDIVTRREDGTARGIIHNQGAIGIDERRL